MSYPAERPAGFGSSAGAIGRCPVGRRWRWGWTRCSRSTRSSRGRRRRRSSSRWPRSRPRRWRSAPPSCGRCATSSSTTRRRRSASLQDQVVDVPQGAQAREGGAPRAAGAARPARPQDRAEARTPEGGRSRARAHDAQAQELEPLVRRALKHQQHNPALEAAVAEQLAIGEELARSSLMRMRATAATATTTTRATTTSPTAATARAARARKGTTRSVHSGG